jgi:hypothetical protein
MPRAQSSIFAVSLFPADSRAHAAESTADKRDAGRSSAKCLLSLWDDERCRLNLDLRRYLDVQGSVLKSPMEWGPGRRGSPCLSVTKWVPRSTRVDACWGRRDIHPSLQPPLSADDGMVADISAIRSNCSRREILQYRDWALQGSRQDARRQALREVVRSRFRRVHCITGQSSSSPCRCRARQ